MFSVRDDLRWTFKTMLGLLNKRGGRNQTRTPFLLLKMRPPRGAAVWWTGRKKGLRQVLATWPTTMRLFFSEDSPVHHREWDTSLLYFREHEKNIFLGVGQLWLVSCRIVFRFGEGCERTETTCFSPSLSLLVTAMKLALAPGSPW